MPLTPSPRTFDHNVRLIANTRSLRTIFVSVLWLLAVVTPRALAQKPSVAQSTPTLLIQTDLDCSFALDDETSIQLKAGLFKRIEIALGEHAVTATSLDGKDRWRTVVNADKPVQKVVLIELQKIRSAREKDEKEAAQLETDIKAKREQAEKLKAANASERARQEAINRHKSEVQDQISELQKQFQQEQASAQQDDASTQTARSCVSSAPCPFGRGA